jgi:hypothetical protein
MGEITIHQPQVLAVQNSKRRYFNLFELFDHTGDTGELGIREQQQLWHDIS